LIPESAARANQ
jgi:hypothetical protein